MQLTKIMNGLKDALGLLTASENDKIMTLIMSLVDFYQFHVTRLKGLVQEKQSEIFSLQTSTVPSLQSTIAVLREENEQLREIEREMQVRVEDARLLVIEKEKEVCRVRVALEEEKNKVFLKRRGEQDWIEELDKLKREIAGLKEVSSLKDDEISYLKKNLRSLEDEIIELRDHKRELVIKIERLQSQPLIEEKNSIEKSSKYLVDQINSLKRELYKAKSVVESYKMERETDRNEFAAHRQIMLERRQEEIALDSRLYEGHRSEHRDKLGSSMLLEEQSKANTPKKPSGSLLEKNYSKDDFDKTETIRPDPSVLGFRRRGNAGERRHDLSLDSLNNNPPQTASSTLQKDAFGDSGVSSEQQQANQRRNPNQGSGNIIAAEYPEEFRRGRNKGITGTRLDSAKKQKLQQDIGGFYCKLTLSRPGAGSGSGGIPVEAAVQRNTAQKHRREAAAAGEEGLRDRRAAQARGRTGRAPESHPQDKTLLEVTARSGCPSVHYFIHSSIVTSCLQAGSAPDAACGTASPARTAAR